MKPLRIILLPLALLSLPATAQQTTPEEPLLDRMIGNWVLTGMIDKQQTTHDVTAEWVLDRHYVRLHEVSREQDAAGKPAYEAIVFIGQEPKSSVYTCLWLDSTAGSGLNPQAFGHARRNGDRIAFLFPGGDGSAFHTTFAYDGARDTWQWLMDDERDGKLQPFARVTLTRGKP